MACGGFVSGWLFVGFIPSFPPVRLRWVDRDRRLDSFLVLFQFSLLFYCGRAHLTLLLFGLSTSCTHDLYMFVHLYEISQFHLFIYIYLLFKEKLID